jgi:hypothetical protein
MASLPGTALPPLPPGTMGNVRRVRCTCGDAALLMFNTGSEHGEAESTFTFEGERLYHASLAPEEYRALLERSD